MTAKKRLTMFDAMDGALSRIGGLKEAAEKAKREARLAILRERY